MKKNSPFSLIAFALLLLAFVPASLFAQQNECATVTPPDFQSERQKQPKEYEKFLRNFIAQEGNRSSCISYAPIKAHILRQSDGSGGLTEADLNTAMATVNAFYANSCMAFYICGSINYIDDDTYYNFDQSEEGALTSANNVTDLINIYFANEVTDGPDNYCGYAYYPGGPDHILMDNSCTMNGSTLAHELGHFFSLPHTHNAGDELVDGSNCSTAGDDFCDTPADPQLSSSNVNSSCDYIGTTTDANGDAYVPNTNNVMSYSRKVCRTEFSTEQYAAMSFTFLNVRNYWDCADFNVDFTATTATNICDMPYTVSFMEDCVGETSYEWDFDNDGIVDDVSPNPSHTYTTAGVYDVNLTISNGTAEISKVKTAYINAGAKPFPYAQSFEGFSTATNATGYGDGWTASPTGTTGSFRWNLGMDGTPSTETGPDFDNTTGGTTGIFAFAESTGSNSGDVAELISPCIDVPASSIDPAIKFWYHMYGSTMGTLAVDLFDGTSWTNDITPAIVGEQQVTGNAAYLDREFSVSAYKGMAIQIRFRAIRGNGFRSDMAIDDMELLENGSPAPVELVDFSGKVMKNGHHALNWQTATEQNSEYFALEHSTDGIHFNLLGRVASQGNSLVATNYDYVNVSPNKGMNYYRLRIVDRDETEEYSPIVQLRKNGEASELSIIPNPGNGYYQLNLDVELNEVNYKITNIIGETLNAGAWNPRDGSLFLDLQHLANGMYLVQIMDGDQLVDLKRLIKQ